MRSFAITVGLVLRRLVRSAVNPIGKAPGFAEIAVNRLITQRQRYRLAVPGVPSPETYVPRHLTEKILASRQSLEGERKQVTVLFADIRSSTKLIALTIYTVRWR
jgi:hypothetical protein